jgi:preprotein translocase subunit SecD
MRPGRQLAVLGAIFVVLYALVFLSGASGSFLDRLHPKLGLDLVGGTRVTLLAQTQAGQAPKSDQLERARQIIENRVNARGVSEAEVVTEGNRNIVVSVPGQNEDLSSIGAAAELRFRKVINAVTDTSAVPASTASPTPSGSASPTPSGSASPAASGSASPTPQASGQGGGAAVAPTPSATASATPSASPTPSPTGTAATDSSGKTREQLRADAERKVGAAAWQAASALTAPVDASTDPTAAQTYAAFGKLTAEEVAALDPAMQFNVPTISCKLLNDRPPGSIVDANQQAVACDEGTKYLMDKAKVLGTDVSDANSVLNQNNERVVTVDWKGSGQGKWTALTKESYDNTAEPKCQQGAVDENGRCRIGIVLDNRVISAPAVIAVQTSGTEITGNFSKASADDLASNLRYGALPLTFKPGEAENVSATLGTEQLRAGLIAAGIGMLLVMIYAFFYYRLLGTVIFLSLILSGLLVFGALVVLGRQIGFTLTLAGIAGFIVSLGVAADSFVIYFERLKDEIRDGRSPRSAVPRAWARARRTIVSANTISLLSAVILYLVSVGSVKGFAFALGLATVLDLVVVFLFRHPIMAMFANTKAFLSPRVSGLGRVLQREGGSAPTATGRSGRTKEA